MNDADPKSEKKTPKPPEPQFFDQPKESEYFRVWAETVFGNRLLRGALLILAAFLIAVFLLYPKSTQKKETQKAVEAGEKREMFSESGVERAIKASVKDSPDAVKKEALPEAAVPKKKRSLKSDISAFIFKPKEEKVNVVPSREKEEKLRLHLPSGTKIPALLEDRIFSFNVAAPVLAVLPKDFVWKGSVIPKNSKFLGEASVLKSVDRINVRFDLLILPDGRELRVRAMALSSDGSSGIRGKVEKHGDTKVLKAIGETLLAGASLFVGGSQSNPYSLQDEMRLNLSRNLTNQAGQDIRAVKTDTSISVEAFIPIQIMLLEAA